MVTTEKAKKILREHKEEYNDEQLEVILAFLRTQAKIVIQAKETETLDSKKSKGK